LDAALLQGGITAVFKSPGLSPADVATLAEAAQARAIPVAGELALFAQALAELKSSRDYAPKVLAITGTNGKTTVTSLTGQLVERAGKSVAVAGNIGPTLLDTLLARLDANALPEVWVLELSSFQLEGERSFEPTAGAVLNISQDHLDWHGSMAAYVQAKTAVFGAHGLMILNREDETVMGMLSADRPPLGAKAPLGGSAAHAMASVGATKASPVRVKLQKPQQRDCVTFGGDMPQRPGDFGIETVNGMSWLVRALEADETIKPRKGEAPELFIQRLMPADALRIRGRHNAINALSSLALACAAGCALGPMLYGLREYGGEPHRVQPVGIINSIEFFDDSKGTNVGATVAALQGLGAERKVVVILGGEGKGQDFSPLAEPVRRFGRAVVLIGRDAPLIRAALVEAQVPLFDADSMADAVAQASAQAHAGDAVLMSPACASFDMFDNYEHRARMFVQAVESLALEAGVMLEGNL
jgi:UDP-N-acetylmuramoylalanine--D-glutamate ligase